MECKKLGLENGPILFCLPGLVGGPEDFNPMLPKLEEKFTILIFDPNSKRRTTEGLNLTIESMNEIEYDSTADQAKNFLVKNYPGRDYYFLGVSLGGKVVYDFAYKYTDLFKGGLVTDVGPGPFSESELFKTIERIVDTVDVNQEWPGLKKSLKEMIPDKNLRIIMQTQIGYPNKTPPAVWKTGIRSIEGIVKSQVVDDQTETFGEIDQKLVENKTLLHVMHSEHISGVGERSYEVLKKMKGIKLHEIMDATHFLHISHKEQLVDIVLSMINSK